MDEVCIKYVPAKRYAEELHSVMLKCFPDFWTPRFAEENYTFPYDVKMYLLTINGQRRGRSGIILILFIFAARSGLPAGSAMWGFCRNSGEKGTADFFWNLYAERS